MIIVQAQNAYDAFFTRFLKKVSQVLPDENLGIFIDRTVEVIKIYPKYFIA